MIHAVDLCKDITTVFRLMKSTATLPIYVRLKCLCCCREGNLHLKNPPDLIIIRVEYNMKYLHEYTKERACVSPEY